MYSLSLLALACLSAASIAGDAIPPPPAPERIEIRELPLPPVTPNNSTGSCSKDINPHETGCIGQTTGLQGGSFFTDNSHVLATVIFSGAPAAPDPASIYTGQQIIAVKTDGTLFSNGDGWKCLTCGVPAANAPGFMSTDYSYPQGFSDGKRVLGATYIVECGDNRFIDDACTPDKTFIYPIRFNTAADGSGAGGSIRELRIHPDQVHIGFNSFTFTGGALGQFGYIGRLSFNKAPTSGIPSGPRYDLTDVNLLFNPEDPSFYNFNGSTLTINDKAITVGELRGFSGTGQEVTYIGNSIESCNIDVFAANLVTGAVRRLTSDPGYVDPVHISADDEWMVIQDTRASNRTNFMDGMRGIPPITDLITVTACSSVRNNGMRRFFQPWLLDKYGDRGDYVGQQLNAAGSGVPGSGDINDPEWNGQADPWFSPDGTQIVYWQAQAVSPACGGANPLPCYPSTEPGGRTARLMLACLIDRAPKTPPPVPELSDDIPWATKYVPGAPVPARYTTPAGNFTLHGKASGYANASLMNNTANTGIGRIIVEYHDFSDDGIQTLNGYQDITSNTIAFTTNHLDWYTNMTSTGADFTAQMVSSEDGFHMSIDVLKNFFTANGTLETTVDGYTFRQPLNNA